MRPNAIVSIPQTCTDEQLRRAESLRISFAPGKSKLQMCLPPCSNRHTERGQSGMPQLQKQTVDLTAADRVVQLSKQLRLSGSDHG
jgi:hypothetical protein